MFFKTLACEYNSLMAILRKRVRLYIFFRFEMERKHIRFQVQTDTRERELHFTLLYLSSSVFSEIFKTVR